MFDVLVSYSTIMVSGVRCRVSELRRAKPETNTIDLNKIHVLVVKDANVKQRPFGAPSNTSPNACKLPPFTSNNSLTKIVTAYSNEQ